MGASNGGNIALWLGITYPDEFGQVIAFSSNVQGSISNTLSQNADLPLRFFIDIGTYDIDVLIPLVQNLQQILQNQNYPYLYHEWHDGHSWGNWRGHIDDALRFTFPSLTPVLEPSGLFPASIDLVQNYPNPFNPTTTISFMLSHRQFVDLTVFSVSGRLVTSLARDVYGAGIHEFVFDGTDLPSGTYFARLLAGAQSDTIKMILVK